MVLVESRVRLWAAGHANRADVIAAVRAALAQGAPTIEVQRYVERRIAHHRGVA